MSFNIVQHFFAAAAAHPDKTALIEGEKKITYRELESLVRASANYHASRSIRKGDRVLVFVPMSITLYVNVLALFHLGATVVFLDQWSDSKRLDACCRIAGCKGFVSGRLMRIARIFFPPLRKIPVALSAHGRAAELARQQQTTAGDIALITFTTGSTGTPKAAVRTHGLLHEQFTALRREIDPVPGDVDLTLLPVVLLLNLGAGATSVIGRFRQSAPRSFDPEEFADTISRNKISRITASPYFIRLLAEYAARHPKKFTSVKRIFTGGAPVFPAQAAEIMRGFGNAVTTVVYGSTEAEPISTISAERLSGSTRLEKGLPAGTLCDVAQVRIIPVTAGPVDPSAVTFCPPGTTGEIIVAGPHVLKEYYNNPDAVKQNKISINGEIFHRTGDSGFLSASGELFLCGRCSNIFSYNGAAIYPFLYEARIQSIPGIALGTVLNVNGMPVVVAEGPRDRVSEIKEALPELAQTGCRFILVHRIPRDPRHYSKIDYEKLREMI